MAPWLSWGDIFAGKSEEEKQREADTEKELGDEAFRRDPLDFDAALKHYNKAISLVPHNLHYYLLKATLLFADRNYQESIKVCMEAEKIGKKHHSDRRLVACACSHAGDVYFRFKLYNGALVCYRKSIAANRTLRAVKRFQKSQKMSEAEEAKAYENPKLAEKEKTLANKLFKDSNIMGALYRYSQAIKRNPKDHKLYSIRATCYYLLKEFNRGLQDCEESITLEPTFVMGYVQKGIILVEMQRPGEAEQAYQFALSLDTNNRGARAGLERLAVILENEKKEQSLF